MNIRSIQNRVIIMLLFSFTLIFSSSCSNKAIKVKSGNLEKPTLKEENSDCNIKNNNSKSETKAKPSSKKAISDKFLFKGLSYVRKKNYDKAFECFNRAIELAPDNAANSYNNRGLIYYLNGKDAEAIKDFEKSIKINPKDPQTFTNLANVYQNKKEIDKSIQLYSKAIEINNRFMPAYASRGYNYIIKKEFDKAVSDSSKAIELAPNHRLGYINRGLAYIEMKEYNKAENDFNKSIELDPESFEAYYNLGKLYDKMGNKKMAIKYYKIFLTKISNNNNDYGLGKLYDSYQQDIIRETKEKIKKLEKK